MKWQDGVIYANQVVKREILVCRNVLLACQRFLNQIENKEWEWEFIPEAVDHFLKFDGWKCLNCGKTMIKKEKTIEFDAFSIFYQQQKNNSRH